MPKDNRENVWIPDEMKARILIALNKMTAAGRGVGKGVFYRRGIERELEAEESRYVQQEAEK